MTHWFPQCPPVARLAFGCVLHHKATDVEEAYKHLDSLLPAVTIDYRNSSDFLYRINRRRKSKSDVPDLLINRLSTWSVVRQFRERVTSQENSLTHSSQLLFIASQLELDINTVPEYQETLPREKLPVLLREFVDLGQEIAVKGDVK